MKKILVIITMLILFFTQHKEIYALSITEIYDPHNLITAQPYYDSSTDAIRFYIGGTKAKRVYYQSPSTTFEAVPSKYGWTYFTGMAFSCNGSSTGILYDSSDNVLVRVKFTTDDIKQDTCTTDRKPIPEPTPVPEEKSNGECSTAICECIEQLKEVNKEVGQSLSNDIKNVGQTISNDIKSVGQTVSNDLKNLTAEFQTTKDYSVKPLPYLDNLIDQNSPDQPQQVFDDKTEYFKDKGDAPEPGKLPESPDIEKWDGVEDEKPLETDDPLKSDKELEEEEELSKDKELEKDTFEREEEMQKDKFTKDQELEKDSFKKDEELEKDSFSKDKELQKDSFSKDEELKKEIIQKDEEMNLDSFKMDPILDSQPLQQTETYEQSEAPGRTHFYEQTNVFP